MRTNNQKNDRPDRVAGLILSPLVSALSRVFKTVKRQGSSPVKTRIETAHAQSELPAIRFEALEPRVLLSGDVNPAALTISGAISVQGEQDHYEFTVEDSRRVVFDSLTNRNDLSWKLDGPNGQVTNRTFDQTDFYATSAAFELDPGKYQLTVDGLSDALGDYALRIIDADAAVVMTPGADVSGTIEGGNKTAVYRFSGTAGDKLYFKPGVQVNNVSWRLIDPFGRQEGNVYNATSDRDTFSLQRTGEYLLLLEGSVGNTAPVNYQFNLRTVADSTAPLTLESTTTANIEEPGQTANFTFNLAQATSVLFDKLTDVDFYWSLNGPAGEVVSRHSTSNNASYSSDSWYSGNYGFDRIFDGFDHLALAAGTYTLTVDFDGAATGDIAFRLLSKDSAQTLLANTLTAGELDLARGSNLFKVFLSQGDKVYLDGQALAAGNIGWRLIDPFGVRVKASNTLTDAVEPFVVNTTGDYWLVFDGSNTNALEATVSYQFALNQVPDISETLVVGAVSSGSIDLAGQATVYSFDLNEASQLVFDAQSNRSDLSWTLLGPRGEEVTNRRFDQSDTGAGFSVLALPSGHYQLTVRGSASATGAFAFNLLDLSAAGTIALDTPILGTLSPGNATMAYSFTAAAGDLVAFQSNSVDAGNATWRLVDRFGRDVAGAQDLASNRDPLVLNVAGIYKLIVEGRVDDVTPISFDVQLNTAGNQAPAALPSGQALTIGTVVAGNLSSAGMTQTYRFTLTDDSHLVMDNQGNLNPYTLWTLVGPRGIEVAQRYFYTSDANYGNPLLNLPAGEYALTVSNNGNGGAYTFRLLDSAEFPALPLDQQTSATRSPANATIGYGVQAVAGTTLLLNSTGSGTWRLIDPFGREVSVGNGDAIGKQYNISSTGRYLLLNEGQYYETGNANVTFTLAQQTRSSNALSFNDQISGSLMARQNLVDYTFTLDQTGTVVFDALDATLGNAANVQWKLTGPKGEVAGWQSLGYDYAAPYGLPPGQYTLTLRNTQDNAANYKFRVLSRDAAIPMAPGVEVNDSFSVGESRIYRFNANAGEHYYFDVHDMDGGYYNQYYNGYCNVYLVDPFGRTVANLNTLYDTADLALNATGEYLLVASAVKGAYQSASALKNVRLNLLPKVATLATLALNDDIAAAVTQPGQSVKYSFTLTTPTTLLVDTGVATNPSALSWSLSGPRGSEASLRSFNASAPDSLMSLPAGNYEFSVAYSDLSTGNFNFRLVDASTTPILTLDSAITLTQSPASHAQAYQLQVTDGGEFVFDPQSSTRATNWRIVDRLGNTLRSGNMATASQPFVLAGGRYFFVVDGLNSVSTSDQYEFTLRHKVTTQQTLVLDANMQGSIDSRGQSYDYSFSASAPTTVLFDSLSNRSDVTWELSGPLGILRSNISFNAADEGVANAPIRLEAAGIYHLRVIPRGSSSGAFNFRLLDLANAQPLPLDSAQTLSLNPGASAKVFHLNGHAGEYLALNLTGVTGGGARVWVIDPAGSHLIEPANALPGSSLSVGFQTSGRYTVVLEGAIGNSDPVELSWTASVVAPLTATLTIGNEISASTAVLGVPDKWNFTLNAPTRVVVDGLTGLGNTWRLRAGDGSLIKSGSLGDIEFLPLAAGAYTLEVQGDSAAVLGTYSLRMLDVAAAEMLTLDQALIGSLDSSHGAKIYRVSTTLENAALVLDVAASNSETGSVRVFDASGNLLGSKQLPTLNAQFSGSTVSGERLVVVQGSDQAATALTFTMTATQVAQSIVQTSLGHVLSAALNRQGETATYRVKVPFSQPLAASTLIHDAGSNDITWSLTRVGQAGWTSTDVVTAGEYDLTVVANADNATYSLQLLNSAAPIVLTPSSTSGHLQQGRDALVYGYDLQYASKLNVLIETANESQLKWTLYDANRNVVVQSDSAATVDTEQLTAGRYFLVVEGQTDVLTSLDFTLHLTSGTDTMTAIALGSSVTGSLSASDPVRAYALKLPFGTYVQIHDQGSQSGIRWKLHTVGGNDNWSDLAGISNNGQDHEASSPYTRYLAAGDYEFFVDSAGLDGDYSFQIVDLDNVPELAALGVSSALESGQGVAAYRLEVAPGQRLEIATGSTNADDVSWVLFDQNKSVVAQGTHAGVVETAKLNGGRHTILIKGQSALAASLDYTLSARVAMLAQAQPGQVLEGDLIAQQDTKTYRVTVPFGGYYQIHNAGSDNAIRWDMSSSASSYPYWVNVVPPQSGGIDNETRYPHTRYFNAGDYDFSVSSNGSDQHFALQIISFNDLPTLAPGPFFASFAANSDVAAYRIDAVGNGNWNIDVSALDANSISWTVFDRYMDVVSESQTAGVAAIQAQSGNGGPYTLEVKRHGTLDAVLDYAVQVETAAPEVLPLDTTQSVSLRAETNTRASYAMSIDQRTVVLFDVLSAPVSAYGYFTIRDAQGGQLSNQSFDYLSWDRAIALNPGNYTIEFSGYNYGATDSTIDFRLLNASAADHPVITLGEPVNAVLTQGHEVHLYQVAGQAGDTISIASSIATGASCTWRLFNPDGELLMSGTESDVGLSTQLRTSGTYLVAIDGALSNGAGIDYSLSATLLGHVDFPVANSTEIVLGSITADVLAAGETKGYRFTLDARSLLAITGAFTDGSGASWELRRGNDYVGNRGYFESYGHYPTVMELEAGEYVLEAISNSAIDSTSITFVIEDTSCATRVAAGDSIVAAGTSLFKMDLTAGQTYFVKANSGTNWKIYQPNLTAVLDVYSYYGDVQSFTPAVSGTWYFSYLQGDSADAMLDLQTAQPLALDAPIAGILDPNRAGGIYTGTLTENKLVYLDLAGSDADVRVVIYEGDNQINSFYGPISDTGLTTPLQLHAGNYRIEISLNGSSNTSAYSLGLLDFSTATPLSADAEVAANLVPGQAVVFKFDAQAGQQLTYTPADSGVMSGRWSLYDEFGNQLQSGDTTQNQPLSRFTRSGVYFLVWDTTADTAGSDCRFALSSAPTVSGTVLVIGSTVEEIVPSGNVTRSYTFTLDTHARLLFDALQADGDDVAWILEAASGIVDSGNCTGAGADTARILDLRADTYTLRISSSSALDATLAFRLLDLKAASTLALGDEASGMLVPGSAVVVGVNVLAGDSFDYVPLTTDQLSGRWMLFDPNGAYAAAGDLTTLSNLPRLTQNGRYTLVWDTDAVAGDDTQTDYRFALMPRVLTLGALVTGGYGYTTSVYQTYEFTVTEPIRVLMDVAQSGNYGFKWTITRAGQSVAERDVWGSSSDPSYNPIIELQAGAYRLALGPVYNSGYYTSYTSYAVRLLDLATVSPLSLDVATTFSRPVGQATPFRLDAQAGDYFSITPDQATSGRWRLVDEFGTAIKQGTGAGTLTNLPRTGSYWLIWDTDGSSYPSSNVQDFSFTVRKVAAPLPTALTLDTVTNGTLREDGKLEYTFETSGAATLWLDPLSQLSLHADILDANGVNLFSGDYYAEGNQAIKIPAAGTYTLKFKDSNLYPYARAISFELRDITLAATLLPETLVSGSVNPANGVAAYRIQVSDTANFMFDATVGAGSALTWKLVSPYGIKLAQGNTGSDGTPYQLAPGDYWLLLDGQGYQSGSVTFSFMVHTTAPELPINTTVSGSTAGSATVKRYQLHLDEAATLAFDNLGTDLNVKWRLESNSGVVFNQPMVGRDQNSAYYANYYAYNYDTPDFEGKLAAGDYTLVIDTVNGAAGDFSFRVLNLDAATPVLPGTPTTTVVTPSNGVNLFRFDAVAGERYYLDAMEFVSAAAPYDGIGDRATPLWTLLDPLGRKVFSNTRMGWTSRQSDHYDYSERQWYYRYSFEGTDQEPTAFSITGTYTLVLEGMNAGTLPQGTVAFNVVKVPDAPAVVLDTLLVKPAPDLAINSVTLNPAGALQTGQAVNVQWVVENRGVLPTNGNWNDRIIVRNLDSGAIVADLTIPYVAGDVDNGAIAAGEARTRNLLIQLPDGALAAGQLSFTVLADAFNSIKESNATGTAEGNNALTIGATVDLAPYADLVIENLVLSPASDFQPGQSVDVTWSSVNRGTKSLDHAWSEHLQVRNLSTNEIVADLVVRDLLEDGTLDVGSMRSRSAQFVWPSAASASGRFSIRIIADSAFEVPEANLAGTGENNNTSELIRLSGPDMRIRNLRVDSAGVQAGGEVTLRWEDWNDGSSAASTSFEDRILVKNTSANVVLLDTSLTYDPLALTAGVANGAILAGGHRERSFTFRLPDGLVGSGDMGITITADQNSAGLGVLFETNLNNDAESNNSASIHATSASKTYADLRLDSLTTPALGVGGEPVTLSWTVSNKGQVDTAAAWNDQVVFSNDAIIGNADDVVIGTVRHAGSLHSGESYSQSATVSIPMRTQGRYYLGVRSDSAAEVLEPDTRLDNTSSARSIDLSTPYADLIATQVSVPANAQSSENILITWVVTNHGNATTDLALWNDRVVLSSDASFSADDIVLSGSVTHAGLLAPGQSYTGRATLTLPRDLSGDFYVIVDTNTNRSVTEDGHTGNNSASSIATLHVGLAPTPDLVVTDVVGPTAVRPGDVVSISYTASNTGAAAASGAWRDRIYLDLGANNLYEVASVFNTDVLEVGASVVRSVNFTLPAGFLEGDFRWVVKTDSDNTVFERTAENNNQATSSATVQVARPDLAVTHVQGPGLVQSGSSMLVQWTVTNLGAQVQGNWIDQVFLSKNAVLLKVAEVARSGPLANGGAYSGFADFVVPLDFSGEYEIVVLADAGHAMDDRARANNELAQNLTVNLAPYADLAVSGVTAPSLVIDDPAPLDVSWTVTNQGTGEGRTGNWTDRIVLSTDETLGNLDDRVVGEYLHTGGLAAGDAYSRSEHVLLGAGTVGRYKLFVVSDAKSEVFENNAEANNIARIVHDVDVMTIAYADLQVESVTTQGAGASGRPLRVTWDVVNNGIGLTNSAQWSDQVWLSRNPDGTDVVAQLGSTSHIGELAVGDRYSRSMDVTLPEGIEGDFYINVRTGGPFEFVFTDNNVGTTIAIPVALSQSPDLKVETITLPVSAQEGALMDVSWSVVNQGEVAASGVWTDTVLLMPISGVGATVTLGSFSYDRGLESGIRYTRTEQVRLPSKIEGQYRVKVITNANGQLYEYGTARDNNTLTSTEITDISLNDRPDLRVGTMVVPEHVTAGTSASIHYTVANMGPSAASGRWKDKVFLSLDATLSGDDVLVGQFDNGAALAPSESYSTNSESVDIPIRYRGDAYLIVVADGNNNVDEYPSEGNNIKAAHFYVDPIPFGDLVASDVVAPDQAVHGASIEVRYKVSNLGSNTTRGYAASVSSWTDTIWLARDKRRPGAYKGDMLLGSVTHTGNLAVGEDYLGSTQVSIPDNVYSGNYFVTVWSDTYDAILEDTLASQLNPDDPNQIDNNNYKARAISVLGITPPDLSVMQVSGLTLGNAGDSYTFNYTVQNRGELFTGSWTDSVFITNNPDLDAATEVWSLGNYSQQRTLGNGERYSVTQTVQLAPSVTGRYVVVKSDVLNHVAESDESNNRGSGNSAISAHPADLQVTSVETQPENYSGEDTIISWTVLNQGDPVWAGTREWVDSIYFSRDPVFIASRAVGLGSVVHSNVGGLATGASYTASAKVKLPAGTDGGYYIYIITDSYGPVANGEMLHGGDNAVARDEYFPNTVYEGARNDNNIARATLNITYREPDLQIDTITVSDPNPSSGQAITVTWTATNRGTRDTRTNSWFDGVYLSRDDSLDVSDHPLVDRGSVLESQLRVRSTALYENNKPKYLKPGESYTNSATFNLPESISGNFHIIVKTDTSITKDLYGREASTIRDQLATLAGDMMADSVKEFKDEGNNLASIGLSINLLTPPDLQVTQVSAPSNVLAGQTFSVEYSVVNAGGDTPSDQSLWNDLVYLSKDRFLDVNQDRYVGYLAHSGGLSSGTSYTAQLSVTAPRDLEGAYYVFVITDPARAWGTGEFGSVREFGKEQNNATAAVQPVIVETPPPADLKVSNVVVPAQANVGDDVQIDYTVINDSINPAYGRWTDALYLSSDNGWDLGDILLGKVDHMGDLGANDTYSGTLTAKLPPLKDGNWRVIVRPDLYNEVFEGKISYTATGLNLPPGEANNRIASGTTLQVQVPLLSVANLLQTTLSAGQTR